MVDNVLRVLRYLCESLQELLHDPDIWCLQKSYVDAYGNIIDRPAVQNS